MITHSPFLTRARTIDHLGREQIADCPTAISELWKNSYDAYAQTVELNIFDDTNPIATVADDGHGMTADEFKKRWLVVGTESKREISISKPEDRNGLPLRTKQGQKGIGRLSSASLGSLLLIVSKRQDSNFVAALIDWRLFENPYLYVNDIRIPVVEFEEKSEIFSQLPLLFAGVLSNVTGSGEKDESERDRRIRDAWTFFSQQEAIEGKDVSTAISILKTVETTQFFQKHFLNWPLWSGAADQGTILVISNIQFDLIAQLQKMNEEHDSTVRQAREQLVQTLSAFSDPLEKRELTGVALPQDKFDSRVVVWTGELQKTIVGAERSLDLERFRDLEHVVEGEVDSTGVFRGRIKAFGTWVDENAIIKPALDIPTKKESAVGPFRIKLGTFELERNATSHSDEQYAFWTELAQYHSGLLVYRNGLRVLPYGREGSDFFRIENRRSKHAGREFWALRRLFGAVSLTLELNPNLRDKAGREGLIDNKAAKSFRDIVENILKHTARAYFGSESDLRKEIIPDRQNEYKKQKAEEARNKQRRKKKQQFRSALVKAEPICARLLENVLHIENQIIHGIGDEDGVLAAQGKFFEAKRTLRELSLGEPPRNLGVLEARYLAYRSQTRSIKEKLDSIAISLNTVTEKIKPKTARDIAYSELNANASFLHRRLRKWAGEAQELLGNEQNRIAEILAIRNKSYHEKMMPLLGELESEAKGLTEISQLLEVERDNQDIENSEIFEPYIATLHSLQENIDLFGLAQYELDATDALREEIDRLHGLAQLGITVEIISHEIEGLENSISTNLENFPPAIKESDRYKLVRKGYDTLVERLRFLSPLQLSGPRTKARISGSDIKDYLTSFFGTDLINSEIDFMVSESFERFAIIEQPSRVYPVFINLVNNALYWINYSPTSAKQISLDILEEKLIVGDSGPGVDPDDIKNLFKLFFTRKARGGRGVGLYLCRTNLAAGGHTISYLEKGAGVLPGANFALSLKGAVF